MKVMISDSLKSVVNEKEVMRQMSASDSLSVQIFGISFSIVAMILSKDIKSIKCNIDEQDIEHVVKCMISSESSEFQQIELKFSDFTSMKESVKVKEIRLEKNKKSDYEIDIIFE